VAPGAGSGAQPGADADRAVVLGRFGAPFGVQGWVRLQSYTDPSERIVGYPALRAGSPGGPVVLREWKRVGRGQLAVRVEGVDSRDAAVALGGRELWVRRDDLPPAAPGEYYYADLVGLEAVNRDGQLLGRVTEIMDLPAHPVLVLRGERERLVPLVPERLVRVELDAGRVTLDWHRDD
jgi:16S rRNA processing protein RimM